jgi:predicted peptidase
MKTFEEIINDVEDNTDNYHQITIDIVDDTEDWFEALHPLNEDHKNDLVSSLSALSYDISVLLEIFNPEFTIEIATLTDLKSHIEIRKAYVNSLEF